jgi:hypothetical protein
MPSRYYSAIAQDTTLTSSITNTATSMIVGATVGYPSTPFVLAVDFNAASEELVLVTNISGTTLTITRGFNGSTAVSHNTGAAIRHVITAQDLTDAQTHYDLALSAGAHGVTGALATFLGTSTSANLAALVSDETGSGSLVFGTAPTIAIGINAQTGTTYTPVLADAAKLVTLNNSGAITLTVPAGVFSAGQIINIQQIGLGQVTVQGDGTSTVTGTGTKLRVQYSAASIVCTATNTFQLIGDLA